MNIKKLHFVNFLDFFRSSFSLSFKLKKLACDTKHGLHSRLECVLHDLPVKSYFSLQIKSWQQGKKFLWLVKEFSQ